MGAQKSTGFGITDWTHQTHERSKAITLGTLGAASPSVPRCPTRDLNAPRRTGNAPVDEIR